MGRSLDTAGRPNSLRSTISFRLAHVYGPHCYSCAVVPSEFCAPFLFLFSPSLLLSSHYSRPPYPPGLNSDPWSHSGPFSPLPTAIRAFFFIARRSHFFFFLRRLAWNSSICTTPPYMGLRGRTTVIQSLFSW